MPDVASQSPMPRPLGRGLNLTGLAATGLEGTEAPPPPVVEGYSVEALLGTGGLGHVWRAVRLADSSTVALKIPHQTDLAFASRLDAEAESLRALDHPHVLRCLSHGTLPNGVPWLALEYVHGAPLSVLIPTDGFSWIEALGHFRRIAAAVEHAHAHGVLHRDLKPSNVLIGHDGSLKVADFGLARSVSERVVTFSLTLSGHIAGTAEYLAPECYARNYHPAEAADIYALGVILYELLAGHPPRGAWSPVSQQKRVDIRVDDVLHRALEPDPVNRFPTVQSMLDALEEIARTPPRYAGTPRLTRAVRFLDVIWTLIGLFLLLGSFGLVVRIEKYGFGLPVDLIGTETIRIGTYQGIVLLLACAFPFGLWQLFRLWRFRAVPLREALPIPFGLKLGTTTTAGFVVLLAQILFLVAPALLGAYAWRERCANWLHETSAPWEQGLVVSAHPQGRIAHDPWAWPEAGKEYFLRERSGWITDPLSKQFDMTSYSPGFMPRCIIALTGFSALVIALTVVSAFGRWWRFRKWGHSVILLGCLGATAGSVEAERRGRAAEIARDHAAFNFDGFAVGSHVNRAAGIHEEIFPNDSPPSWVRPPESVLERYAESVDFGDGTPRSGPAIADWLADFAARSRREHRSTTSVDHHFFPADWKNLRFRFHSCHLDCTDPPDGPSTGALTVLVLQGNILPKIGAEITEQSTSSLSLWEVERRTLSAADALAWVDAFLAALLPSSGPGGAANLSQLMHPQLLQFVATLLPLVAAPSQPLIDSLRLGCEKGSRPVLARPPAPAVAAPGGRQRLILSIEDRGQPATWTVDLIYSDGRWQCVRMVF